MDEAMSVSVKVLKNPTYKVTPVFKNYKNNSNRPENLLGVRLHYAKSGANVWDRNGGLIAMEQLHPDAREYVKEKFTNRDHLKVFGSIGD